MQLLQGNHYMFCDIHIFSATTTTAETLHFSVQELTIAECSGHVQVKFWLVFLCKPSFLWIFHAKIKFCVFFRGTMYVITFFVVQLVKRASNCFSCVIDAVSQRIVLDRFPMTRLCKAFVNACCCSVHKCILRNVFTDFEHNYVEIYDFCCGINIFLTRQDRKSVV